MPMKNEQGLAVAEKVRQSLELLLTGSVLEVWCAAVNLGRSSTYRFSDRLMDRFAWVTQDSCTGDILVWMASQSAKEVVFSKEESTPTPRCHHETFPALVEGLGYARNVNYETAAEAAKDIFIYLQDGIRPALKVYDDALSHVEKESDTTASQLT